MRKHEEITNELLHLITQHPDRRVIVQVPTEGVVASCDYDWWASQLSGIGLDEIYTDQNGQVHMRSDDEDDLIDGCVYEWMCDDPLERKCTDEAVEEAEKAVDEYPWKKVIVVKVEAWE